jgi:hypothetical protein
MFHHTAAVLLSRACTAIARPGVMRALHVGVVLLGVPVLMASAARIAAAQQSPGYTPLFVVESFLAARNARDPFGATGWCAAMLELQDIDGQWFVDEPTTRYWLRQLTDKYLLETLSRPVANGNTVTWTERLTPRTLRSEDPWSKSMTVPVSAVIRDGTIAYLSGPYPPLPLRPAQAAVAVQSSGSPVSTTTASVAPATMFLGSALGLMVTAFLVARGAPAVRAAFRRRLP